MPTTSNRGSANSKSARTPGVISPGTATPSGSQKAQTGTLTVFVSYRRSDQVAAAILVSIYDRLVAHFGKHSVFRDIDSVPLGIDFRKYIAQYIQKADVCVALIGPQWEQLLREHADKRKDFVVIELEEALRKDIPVIPVLIGGAEMPSDEELPTELKELAWRNGLPMDHRRGFNTQMALLIRGIELSASHRKRRY